MTHYTPPNVRKKTIHTHCSHTFMSLLRIPGIPPPPPLSLSLSLSVYVCLSLSLCLPIPFSPSQSTPTLSPFLFSPSHCTFLFSVSLYLTRPLCRLNPYHSPPSHSIPPFPSPLEYAILSLSLSLYLSLSPLRLVCLKSNCSFLIMPNCFETDLFCKTDVLPQFCIMHACLSCFMSIFRFSFIILILFFLSDVFVAYYSTSQF